MESLEFTGIPPGTRVLVRNLGDEWEEAIFLTSIRAAWCPYICVRRGLEEEYYNQDDFEIEVWQKLKKIEETPEI